jgi:hypothetical protein
VEKAEIERAKAASLSRVRRLPSIYAVWPGFISLLTGMNDEVRLFHSALELDRILEFTWRSVTSNRQTNGLFFGTRARLPGKRLAQRAVDAARMTRSRFASGWAPAYVVHDLEVGAA